MSDDHSTELTVPPTPSLPQMIADIVSAVPGVQRLFAASGMLSLFNPLNGKHELVSITDNEVIIRIGIREKMDPRQIVNAVITAVREALSQNSLELPDRFNPETARITVTIVDIGQAILPQNTQRN